MPFQSKAQMRACFAKNDPKWNCKKWAAETPNVKKLPNFKGASPHASWRQAHMARHGIKC